MQTSIDSRSNCNSEEGKKKKNNAVMSLAGALKEINCLTSLLLNESSDKQSVWLCVLKTLLIIYILFNKISIILIIIITIKC